MNIPPTFVLLPPVGHVHPGPGSEGSQAPQAPSRRPVETLKYCRTCDLEFEPGMMAFHRSHAHLVLHCQLCHVPLQRLGIIRDLMARGQFCSSVCKEEAWGRGLCIACSKEPDGTFRGGICLRCRREYANIDRQIRAVNGTLGAIRRAEVLPAVYERSYRDAW